ncbi:sensor histidine kinase [Paenibacillus abyssi]|uniref:histidine kinase n=1 Tax=Paenibacillus abyssi TaxID=1340531 RepID=A0A917FRF4_9BACL|nr:HAMP domain-containing sensor histidine kinase [Paenibacillus abyssi]GGF96469.1 hypothetical protein GCM10010916_12130 [Paenibacillus abyssi]
MKISIKLKLSIVLAGLLIATVGVLSQLVLQGIERNQRLAVENELAKHSEIANLRARQTYLMYERVEDRIFLQRRGQELAMDISRLSGLTVIIYNAEGREVGNSLQLIEMPSVEDTLSYALQGKTAYQISGESLVYMAPLYGSSGQIGVVQFHYSLKSNQAFYQAIERLFLTAGLVVLVAGFLLGYVYFHRFAAVIYKLRNAAESIRQGSFLKQQPIKRGDELGELSQGIFYMSREMEHHIKAMEDEQRKLKLAIEKLQALEQQQKQFIGNISHEFKTPLTSIKAYVDLLDMYRDDPKLIEEAHMNIGKETERLHEMVEKVLQLSALEKYDFEMQPEPVEIKELLLDICGRMRGKAAKFGLGLEISLEPAVLWADRESLMHIFINVIDNAIKYNVPDGHIKVQSEVDSGRVRIQVIDTGIGIPEEVRDKIFEPFFTVNKDRSRGSGGTGLGLSLVKRLVEKQRGELTIHSGDQQGTIFMITFPIDAEKFTTSKQAEM